MEKETYLTGLIFGSGVAIGLVVGFMIGFERSEVGYERTLYNHDLGTYNPKNGDFIPIWEIQPVQEEVDDESGIR